MRLVKRILIAGYCFGLIPGRVVKVIFRLVPGMREA